MVFNSGPKGLSWRSTKVIHVLRCTVNESSRFDICVFFEILSTKFKFYYSLTRIMGTLHWDQYTFFIIFCSFLPRMRNVSDRSCSENQNTRFMFNNFFFENCSFYEMMWKIVVQTHGLHTTIWRVRSAYWITKATNHTLRICNTYCFFTATIVKRTHLSVKLQYSACLVDCMLCICAITFLLYSENNLT
jgi:hypothetical protein